MFVLTTSRRSSGRSREVVSKANTSASFEPSESWASIALTILTAAVDTARGHADAMASKVRPHASRDVDARVTAAHVRA